MNWYLSVLKRYAIFKGRATRKEFWWFTLIHIIVVMILLVIDFMMNNIFVLLTNGETEKLTGSLKTLIDKGEVVQVFGITMMIYLIISMIPQLAVTVRRLQDSGKSGWWVMLGLIPFGVLLLIVLLALPSESRPNKYGDVLLKNNITSNKVKGNDTIIM